MVYDLQVAMKPLSSIVSQNLLCEGNQSPPELFEIKDSFYKFNRVYSLSGQYLFDEKPSQWDFTILMPHSDYLLDLQIQTDFLTTDFGLSAYIQNPVDKEYTKIAEGVVDLDSLTRGR